MRLPLSKQKRMMLSRRIKDFWVDYKRNKIGLVGIAFLLGFTFMAVFAPLLTKYHPTRDYNLAESMAMPQWVTAFPQHHNLPPTINVCLDQPQANQSIIDMVLDEKLVVVRYLGGARAETEDAYLRKHFPYQHAPPKTFKFALEWTAKPAPVGEVGYSIELFLITPEGQEYSLWDSKYGYGEKSTTEIPLLTLEKEYGFTNMWSTDPRLLTRFGYKTVKEQTEHNIATEVFDENGEYCLLMHIRFEPTSKDATCEITLKNIEFKILGLAWGILGTDRDGADIFSQLVHGTRISLGTGLMAGFLLSLMGTIVGVISGYMGGIIDELLMRTADILLCLPLLPFFLTLILVFGRSIIYIVIILGFFLWPQPARVIRSHVLSIREMAFVESAKAGGATRTRIMLKHIAPNVFPIIFALLVYSLPGAILFEASLSFLGFGDPNLATWGRMLYDAFHSRAFERLAWWWILPPGIAIMLLSTSFVFIGHAVDEIVNPRLRRRR